MLRVMPYSRRFDAKYTKHPPHIFFRNGNTVIAQVLYDRKAKNMLCSNKITHVSAREIIDSRGNPTLEATVILEDGSRGTAGVPSGASTGRHEACELRDRDSGRYGGKGVLKAVENVNTILSEKLCGMVCNQGMVDCVIIKADGSEDKSHIGANATLAVSLAAAKAGASHAKIPLYRYIGGVSGVRLPIPMMNILNGGAHAANNLDIQEFMIVPEGFDTFADALRAGCEVHHALSDILKRDGHSSCVGDEGGCAPNLTDEREALDYIMKAVEKAGYSSDEIKIALDCAASEWASDTGYRLPKSGERASATELIDRLEALIENYPIISVEDPLGEDDEAGWCELTERLGEKIMLVGDDFFVTNPRRVKRGIELGAANAVLIKPNQIGTLSETLEVVRVSSRSGYERILSHRSGETCDTTIADIAVGVNCGYIKTGAPCRGERTSKYNRLLEIAAELGSCAVFGI